MKLSGAARPILLCPSSLSWSQKRYVRNICTCISLNRWSCNALRRSPHPPPRPLLDRWPCIDGWSWQWTFWTHSKHIFQPPDSGLPIFSYSNWNAAHLQQLNLPWGCRGVGWSEVDLIALLLSPYKIRESSCAAVLLLTLVSNIEGFGESYKDCLHLFEYI